MSKSVGRSAAALAYRKLYNGKRWQQLRRQHLTAHPLCALCYEDKALTPAQVVHHIKAHKGNEQ
ncbi:MAG TPA: HNH endonuclease, partial [Hyphomicrobiaceae bacterium]